MIETVEELVRRLLALPQNVKPYIQITEEEDVPITDVIFDEQSNEVIIETE